MQPLPPASPFAARRTIALVRPWPLLLPLGIDLTSSIILHMHLSLPLLLLSALRIIVLAGLATSPRWKSQGSILLSVVGATLITCTWEACAPLLRRVEGVNTLLLLLESGLSISEYLFFLLLVRLTPTPFAPRPLPGVSPTISPAHTPLSSRPQPTSSRPQILSHPDTLVPASLPSVSSYGVAQHAPSWPEFEDAELGLGSPYDSHSECSSCSSFSESSIIDLPRPRPPAPILVDEESLSALAAVEGASDAVRLVRRSASARFGRSVEERERGYGTFDER